MCSWNFSRKRQSRARCTNAIAQRNRDSRGAGRRPVSLLRVSLLLPRAFLRSPAWRQTTQKTDLFEAGKQATKQRRRTKRSTAEFAWGSLSCQTACGAFRACTSFTRAASAGGSRKKRRVPSVALSSRAFCSRLTDGSRPLKLFFSLPAQQNLEASPRFSVCFAPLRGQLQRARELERRRKGVKMESVRIE